MTILPTKFTSLSSLLTLLTITFTLLPTTTLALTEREALEQFYTVAHGTEWTNKYGWDGDGDEGGATIPICSWHGIACQHKDPSLDYGVTDINLPNNNLKGMIVGHIWDMPNLVYVNLKGNKLDNAGFEDFNKESKVQIVDLSSNLITTLEGIGSAPRDLRWLFLSHNKIAGPLPEELYTLTNLRKLHLDDNLLTGSLSPSISSLTRLLQLNLAHNDLDGTIPPQIGTLASLQDLNLAENDMQGDIPQEMNSLINLQSLSLHNSEMGGLGGFTGSVPSFRDSVFLKTILLDGNELTGTIPTDLIWNSNAGPNDLITLGLSNNHLTGSVPETLMRFNNVYLDIVGNQLTRLSEGFCEKIQWMNSKVESYGCDAIACPPGSMNERYGRREVSGEDGMCSACEDVDPAYTADSSTGFYGSYVCGHEETAKEKELAALIAFYHDLSPSKWKSKDNWELLDNDGDDDAYYYVYTESLEKVCDFYGVECNDEGYVTAIVLQDNGLHGQIHPAIFSLEYLELLDVSYNKVWMHGFEGLENSKALVYFDISGTDIQSLEGISYGYGLEYFFMDDLIMFDHDIHEIFEVTTLIDFTAKNSGIKGKLSTYNDKIGKMSNLLRLDLYGNDFSGVIPSNIGNLTQLEELDLSENLFGGEIPNEITSMPMLKNLRIRSSTRDIAFNEVGEPMKLNGQIPSFENLPKIKVLELDFNNLEGALPTSFLGGVEDKGVAMKVGLAYNNIIGAVPTELESFASLDIDLIGNKIAGLDSSFNSRGSWMNNQVSKVAAKGEDGKDAIMCPPGKYNQFGRAFVLEDLLSPCKLCADANHFGVTYCESDVDSHAAIDELEILLKLLDRPSYNATIHKPLEGLAACSFPGVDCTAGGRVEKIDWSQYGLSGEVSNVVWDLEHLTHLNLRGNPVTIDFTGVGNSKILELSLSDTNIKSLAGIGAAKDTLKKIDFARNDLTGEIPSDLYSLTKLQTIHMGFNHFYGTIDDSMQLMTHLVEFFCEHCGLSGSLYDFAANSNLKKLDLSFNDFYGEIPDSFIKNVNRDEQLEINLAYNDLEGDFPEELTLMNKLYIDLEGNLMDGLDESYCPSIWMKGETALLSGVDKCDAIMCPPGTMAANGKAIPSKSIECEPCPDGKTSTYYGGTTCEESPFEGERDILEEFYTTLNGPNWYRQNKWGSTESICSWYGVGCSKENDSSKGHVTSLVLDNNNLVGDWSVANRISEILFRLEYIRKIDLSGNGIHFNFEHIGLAKYLHSLYLSGTEVKTLKKIGRAKDLRHLRVEDNRFNETIPDELYDLKQIKSIHLSNSLVKGYIDGDRLKELVHLEEFYASNNQLKGEVPSQVGQLAYLRVLDLGRNHLSSTIPVELGNLMNLRQLSLENQRGKNKIGGTLPSLLNARKLEILELQGNEIRNTIPADFLGNSEMKDEQVWINLDYNQLAGTIPDSLKSFKRLYINLIGNKMDKIFSDDFCKNAKTSIPNWMDGDVGKYGCTAISCPPQSFSALGKENDDIVCKLCSSSKYSGSTVCSRGADEKAILKALYLKLGGDSWINKKHWMDDKVPICKWEGVMCEDGVPSDTGGVTTLNFEDNQLIGGVPDVIFSMPFLRGLILKGNDITISFANLKTASALELLNLSETRIESIDGISAAKNLQVLHLTDNNLYGPIDELCKMTTLRHLYIAYNHFERNIPKAIGDMANLEYFYAYGNDLTGSIPTEIGKLSVLKDFVLSENLISGQLPDEIGTLPNLQLLSFYRHLKSGPKLRGTLPSFSKAPSLQKLYLDYNNIGGKIPDDFVAASTRIQEITIAYNDISGGVPLELSYIDEAISLELQGNRITNLPDRFCEKADWMDGLVETEQCDAILCRPGYITPVGRTELLGNDVDDFDTSMVECTACQDMMSIDVSKAKYYGSTSCAPMYTERQVLEELYNSCGGKNWLEKSKWTSSSDICEWYGITCNPKGKVTSIRLEENGLTCNETPSSLFELRFLVEIWLSSNKVRFNFNGIEKARELVDLRLDETLLTNLNGIGSAKSLKVFTARKNNIVTQFPSELLQLSNLQLLNLGENGIRGQLPDSFGETVNLVDLMLDSNSLTGTLPTFEELGQLRLLELSTNDIEGTIPELFLDGLPSRRSVRVHLEDNKILGSIPERLGRFELLGLYLGGNKIEYVPPSLCLNHGWNNGEVGQFSCPGLICPPGTYNDIGRQSETEGICKVCKSSQLLYGQKECASPSSGERIRVGLVTATVGLVMMVMALF